LGGNDGDRLVAMGKVDKILLCEIFGQIAVIGIYL